MSARVPITSACVCRVRVCLSPPPSPQADYIPSLRDRKLLWAAIRARRRALGLPERDAHSLVAAGDSSCLDSFLRAALAGTGADVARVAAGMAHPGFAEVSDVLLMHELNLVR